MRDLKQTATTDDTTLDDEYEMLRLDALPSQLRDLAGLHVLDQFDSVPSFFGRFTPEEKADGR
jgi:hypothetical protein